MIRRKRRIFKPQGQMQQQGEKTHAPSGSSASITSWLKNINLKDLSGHLHNIADIVENIGQITGLVNSLAGPETGTDKGLGLTNLFNNNSLNQLVQAFLPVLQDSDFLEETQENPIRVNSEILPYKKRWKNSERALSSRPLLTRPLPPSKY